MKKTLLLFIVFLITVPGLAQYYTWQLRQTGTSLGHPICQNPFNPNTIYYGTTDRLYKSGDRGESFVQMGNPITGATRVKTMIFNQKDPNIILVAVENSPLDQIVKTTDGGQTWSVVLSATFSFFGIPMTVDPKKPDTVYTMDNTNFMRSTNFGTTWTTITNTVGSNSAPCDIEVFKDSNNVILVGDNGTGIFRSSDFGVTWRNVFSTSGEIPTIVTDKNTAGTAYATRWGGGGGFMKSTDYGATWTAIAFFNGKSMWGVDVCPQDPKTVMAGQYSGSSIYITKDGGNTWLTTTLPASNYAILIQDTSNVFSAQSGGIYKMRAPWDLTPVELTNFSATVADGRIILTWKTATETNNRGFDVELIDESGNARSIGYVQGHGTTTEVQDYQFIVEQPLQGRNEFRLKQTDFDGTIHFSHLVYADIAQISSFTLGQNFPNPFNPSSKVTVSLPEAGVITLTIYNTAGEQLQQVTAGSREAGVQEFTIDASCLNSGVYFYKATFTGSNGLQQSLTKKLTVLK